MKMKKTKLINAYDLSKAYMLKGKDKLSLSAVINELEMQPAIDAVLVKHVKWIPVEERLPDMDLYVLVSFENFNLPDIGRYESNKNGGLFYSGDDDKSYAQCGLRVNAWMPLPEPYRAGN